MKNLAIISPLSPVETEIARAIQSVKVRDTGGVKLAEIIKPLISYSHQYRGQSATDKVLDFQVGEVIRDLRFSFKNIGIEEIKIAFHRGVRGEYGDFFGLNNDTYRSWVKSYVKSEARLETSKKLLKLAEDPKPPMTPEQYDKLFQENYDRCLAKFTETGEIVDFGNAVYDELVKRGKIEMANDDKWEIYRAAEKVIQDEDAAEFGQAKEHGNFSLVREIQRKIDAFKVEGKNKEARVRSVAKRLALREYFMTISI